MNEQEVYKTVIRNRIADDDTVKRYATAALPKGRPALRVLKPIGIAFAALLVVFGVTMSIPSARAEVLSWFQPKTPGEYIAVDPEDRDPIPELEAMIVTPAPVETPAPSATPAQTKAPEPTAAPSKAADESNDELWDEIRNNFSAHIGETLFDGHTLYMTIDLDGICGLLAFENDTSHSFSAGTPHLFWLYEKIEPEYVKYFYEESANLTRYYSGAMEFWMAPDSFVRLVLDEEKQAMLYGTVSFVERPVDRAFSRALIQEFGSPKTYREDDAAEFRRLLKEHFEQNGARALVTFRLHDGLATAVGPESSGLHVYDYLDKNGYMEAKAVYRVILDHGTIENTEVKFQTEIGTIGMNMKAFQGLSSRKITAGDSIAFSGETVFYENTWDDAENNWTLINRQVDLDGVSISVKNPGYLDLFGIHELSLSLNMPDDWSDETKSAFAKSLMFDVTLDDDLLGPFSANVFPDRDGTYTLAFLDITDIPFDRYKTIKSIRLTPSYAYCTSVSVCQREPEGSESPRTVLYTVPMGPNDSFRADAAEEGTVLEWEIETVRHPEWTILLSLN